MKKYIKIGLLIAIVFATVFSGCRYKEGPLISFRSVEKRITGIWQVVGFTSDGVDSLQYYNESYGGIMDIWQPKDSQGMDYNIWFDNGKKKIYGTFNSFVHGNKKIMNVSFNGDKVLGPIGPYYSTWKILKLENKKLKISTNFNGRNYIISFKKE